jgi:Mn2+/Fe2+ NRAMP family transporter
MTDEPARTNIDRQRLLAAQQRGPAAKLFTFARLSGPGWLQSAITLGGGSLASSLYLGVVAGFTMLWVQPIAMVLGIIMLSGIAYVTLSTGQRPFRAINRHVNPVLGWSWALAALAANMFWCLPQYSLATGVLEQNLLPEIVGPQGAIQEAVARILPDSPWLIANAAKLVLVAAILFVTTIVTWSYNAGRWGIKLYELVLKLMVAGIVLCFFGVIWTLRQQLDWGAIGWGFVPDLRRLFEPSDRFQEILQLSQYASIWSTTIVNEQREILISAAATAVGINMTFLFPYSLLAKKWTREFRGLAIFDLSTGMLIPFVLATSCVVIASANRFHARPVEEFLGKDAAATKRYYELLTPILQEQLGSEEFSTVAAAAEPLEHALATLPSLQREKLDAEAVESFRVELARTAMQGQMDRLPEVDRKAAAMLIRRSPFDLAKSLAPLTGDRVANVIFGLGVLGMTLSTITILMLISGFVICEIFNLPQGGWAYRWSCMAAATGALGPFIWSKASFYLAVYVSVFGMMLLPIAYLSFLFLMNRPRLLGRDMPRGGRRWLWNSLLGLSAGVATLASLYSVWKRAGQVGIAAMAALLGLAIIVQIYRWFRPPQETDMGHEIADH